MSEPLLKVENVAASYGSIVALKSVSLEVYEGEIVTIVGANGAGKTTLLSCISGLMPYKGSIAFKGEKLGGKIDSAGIVERGVIQVPEGRQIFSDMTVHENLLMGAYSRKKGDNIQPELDEVYELFPRLAERRDQKGGGVDHLRDRHGARARQQEPQAGDRRRGGRAREDRCARQDRKSVV